MQDRDDFDEEAVWAEHERGQAPAAPSPQIGERCVHCGGSLGLFSAGGFAGVCQSCVRSGLIVRPADK
ncbi:MAG: hypothetical protein JWP35_2535 [Caulobacter sp.]|nr:hypothetical protein [Caulobacter sp.]